ncbi:MULTISPECIES: GNAT family N-acetyltransferase [unclassified Nonomuraea]|uniref:GNAT family N-acetyltransferase n=1 Tax=unclassified Nonomuraea TaxID=2593643 RepID=UPI0033D3F1CF
MTSRSLAGHMWHQIEPVHATLSFSPQAFEETSMIAEYVPAVWAVATPRQVNFERLTGHDALARAGHLVEIYRSAFGEPPWCEDERAADAFAERLTTDVRRPGFTAVLAYDHGEPAGFGTAWRTRSPFPVGRAYDLVRAELGDAVETRLVGALEVDELAVSPHARRQGLAGRILDLLCDGDDACWLLTAPQAEDAIRLYERLGWRRLTAAGANVVVFSHRKAAGSAR